MKLDQVVREGEDVVLACKAGGHPAPKIKWRREDGGAIRQEEGETIMLTICVLFCGQVVFVFMCVHVGILCCAIRLDEGDTMMFAMCLFCLYLWHSLCVFSCVSNVRHNVNTMLFMLFFCVTVYSYLEC